MSGQQIHALLIEDDPDDVLLLKDSLADIGAGTIKLDSTDRLSRGLIQLGSQNYDVILLDLNLPDSRGLDTLNTAIKRFPKLPVVVLSGLADDAITIEAVRRGAQDYLVKGEINGPLVLRVIRYAIERKQVEAVLRASEARYRTLVETSPNGITLADLEGKVLLCNQQAARLYGYSNPEAMLGLNFFKLVAPTDRQQAATNINKALNEGRITNAEYTLQRRDGSQFPGEVSSALQRNTIGAPTGFINISRDISERKKAVAVEKQVVMLEKEFMSTVSQQLQTPLLDVMDCLNRIRSGGTPTSQSLAVDRATRDASQLLNMVNELLDFSLLESERLMLNWERTDLGRLITEAMHGLREMATSRQVSLMSTPMGTPLFAYVDPSRMRRVLDKLVTHAIIFSDRDGSVLITAREMSERITINVVDESGGIPQEEISRIFDKYYQVNHPTGQNSPTTGLGLYTAKHIVEAHGGNLTVSSQMGSGTTFTISLPVEKSG